MLQAPRLEPYAGGYDPTKRKLSPEELMYQRCDYCGVPLRKTKYRYQGKDYCFSCVLEEADIKPIGVDH